MWPSLGGLAKRSHGTIGPMNISPKSRRLDFAYSATASRLFRICGSMSLSIRARYLSKQMFDISRAEGNELGHDIDRPAPQMMAKRPAAMLANKDFLSSLSIAAQYTGSFGA